MSRKAWIVTCLVFSVGVCAVVLWNRRAEAGPDAWVTELIVQNDVFGLPNVVVFPDRLSLQTQDWGNTYRLRSAFNERNSPNSLVLLAALRAIGGFLPQSSKEQVTMDEYPENGGVLLEVEDGDGTQWRLLLVVSPFVCSDEANPVKSKCKIQNVGTGDRWSGYCVGPCSETWAVFPRE